MPQNLINDGQILLYGDVGDPWGFGDGFTPADVAAALTTLGPGPVTVRLNSGGGVAFDGIAIYSLLMAHKGAITTVVDGIAASAASLIFMAGEVRQMRKGSMLMIHDAGGITFGNAADHAQAGAVLDKLSDQYAGIYADRVGGDVTELRTQMQAETWMDSLEAIAAALATGEIEDTSLALAAFDYRLYAHAPRNLPQRADPPKPGTMPVATMPNPTLKGHEMPQIDNPTLPVVIPVADPPLKSWAVAFYETAARVNLTLAETNAIVASSVTLEQAKDALIDLRAAAQTDVPNRQGGRVQVTADGRDKMVEGISAALLARGGIGARDATSEFNGFGPMDVVRHTLAQHNYRAGVDPRRMVAAAITQTGSDFANIVSNVANKSMLRGYDEAAETFQLWTDEGDLPDFKLARRVDLNAVQSLAPKLEAQEYKALTTGDRGEAYAVTTCGGIFNLSREAIINDDLDIFVRLPNRLGRAAKRTIGDAVYGALFGASLMSDGNPLFVAAHNNVMSGAASALSSASLQAADLAMGLQKDRTNKTATLNIIPKYLITPRALKFTALQLVRSTAAITGLNAGVKNPVENIVEQIISEPRLDAISPTAWYLVADQFTTDTMSVVYMRGQKKPMLEAEEAFNVDGLTWKVRLDFGVKAFGWEGFYKSFGV